MRGGREAAAMAVAAGVEAMTGAVLIVRPALFARLVLDGELSDAGEMLARLTGFTLLALVLACWPRREAAGATSPALQALLLFSLLTALYLAYVGFSGGSSGQLLWPAVALHAVLTVVITLAWRGADRDRNGQGATSGEQRVIQPSRRAS
jgi:hypothetical protein